MALLITLPKIAYSTGDDLSGYTVQQLDTAITKGGLADQKIYSILTFDSDQLPGANIAILSSSHTGWHVTILHRINGGLKVEWRSGKLPDDIAVSSYNSLKIEHMDDGEQVVEFSGCAAHECGGVDGVFGVLLYSSRSKQVFYAHYRWDEGAPLGSFGSLDFSKNATAAENEKYKMALQKAMNKALGWVPHS